MAVSYETGPQGNLAWFKDQIASLRSGIEEAQRAARQASSRGGVVMGTWGFSGLAVTPQGTQVLQRRGKLVTGLLRVQTTAAIGQYNVIAQLPAGFRPDPAGNDILLPGAQNAGGAWSAMTYYISASDGGVRPLTAGIGSGSVPFITLTPFAAGA